MSTAAIDMALLDELFEKQNKLDEILFDDPFFSIAMPSEESDTENTSQNGNQDSADRKYDENLYKYDYAKKTRSKIALALPLAAEISVIVYLIMNFT